MSLTWQIVRKDLRRMAVPVALWCLLVAVITIAMRTVPMTLDFGGLFQAAGPASAALRWMSLVETFGGLAIAMQTGVGVVLAAVLIQLDPLVGTRAFWQTRPISDARLLRAKLIAGALLLVLAPALVIAAIGWSCGFSWSEGVSAAGQFMVWQVIAVSVGFAVGSITANLGTFLFSALLGSALFPIIMIVLYSGLVGPTTGQVFTLKCVVMFGPAIILLAQAFGRKRKLGWWAYGIALLIALLAAFGTPELVNRIAVHWNNEFRLGGAVTAVDRQLVVRLAPGDSGEHHTIRALVDRAPMQDTIPVVLTAGGRSRKNGRVSSWSLGPRWGDEESRRMIGVDQGIAPATWQLAGRSDHPVDDIARFDSASAVVAWTKPTVLWETPVRVGARVSAGSSASEIVAVAAEDGGVGIILRESDAQTRWRSWPNLGRVNDSRDDARDHDCFLLKDSAHGSAVAVDRVDLESVSLNGMMITARRLRIAASTPESDPLRWLEGKTLVKVRFFGVRAFFTKATAAATNISEPTSPTQP